MDLLPDRSRSVVSLNDITDLKESQRRIMHLNRVLSALRNINQAIVSGMDREALMMRVCEILVEEAGYFNAWIISTDEDGSLVLSGEAGLERRSEELRECLQSGKLVECNPEIMGCDDAVRLKPLMMCPGCPLTEASLSSEEMTIPISYLGRRYGLLIV